MSDPWAELDALLKEIEEGIADLKAGLERVGRELDVLVSLSAIADITKEDKE